MFLWLWYQSTCHYFTIHLKSLDSARGIELQQMHITSHEFTQVAVAACLKALSPILARQLEWTQHFVHLQGVQFFPYIYLAHIIIILIFAEDIVDWLLTCQSAYRLTFLTEYFRPMPEMCVWIKSSSLLKTAKLMMTWELTGTCIA